MLRRNVNRLIIRISTAEHFKYYCRVYIEYLEIKFSAVIDLIFNGLLTLRSNL